MNQLINLPSNLYWYLCPVEDDDFIRSNYESFNTEFWLHEDLTVEKARRIDGEHCYITIIDCYADNCEHTDCKRFVAKIAQINLAVHCNSCAAKLAYDDIDYTKNGKVNNSPFTIDMVFEGQMPVCEDCKNV